MYTQALLHSFENGEHLYYTGTQVNDNILFINEYVCGGHMTSPM